VAKVFAICHNDEHLNSAIRFVTPNMRHGGKDRDAPIKRGILYANVRAKIRTMVRKDAQLAARRRRLADPERKSGAPENRDAA
jgi:putative transposase